MRFSSMVLMLIMLFPSMNALGQEKGKFKNNPTIRQGDAPKTEEVEEITNEELPPEIDFEFFQKDIKTQDGFTPSKPVNPVVSEDTSSLGESSASVVEIVDSVKVGDEFVKAAEYYAIWDSKSINPYRIDPLKFNKSIDLELYNDSKGRNWHLPLDNVTKTSNFGFRWGRYHLGTDFGLRKGDPVYSAFDGKVRVVGTDGNGYGRYVLVRHYNGLETLYGHLSKQLVQSGDMVKAGDTIGLGGSTGRSTGAHLHFETRYEGNSFDSKYIYDWTNANIRSDHFLLTKKVWDFRRLNRTVYHRVRSGEVLSTIARKYGLKTLTLARMNGLTTNSIIRVGQKLKVR